MKNLQASFNTEPTRVLRNPEGTRVLRSHVIPDRSTVRHNQPSVAENANPPSGRDEAADLCMTRDVVETSMIEMATIANEANDDSEASKHYVEPKTFNQAWNHPDPVQRAKWREGIRKEFDDMKKRSVWVVKKRSEMPSNRRLVKCKWVFKIKRNGVFRARLVACGYSQIPGVDFTENYSPVINDITFRLLILAMMFNRLDAKIVDVETAFLYGTLEEEIYMECPPGMGEVIDDCREIEDSILLLRQCIYGLVQAARQYYKRFVTILKKIGFKGGDVDPCLFSKKSEKGLCFIAIYVDDNLMIGHNAAIEDAIHLLKKENLVLKIEDSLHDYLSCEVKFSKDMSKGWLGQPHMISSIQREFGEEVKGLRRYLTPGTPGARQVRADDPKMVIPTEKHARYRTGVGMLLYLVKHSRPDIANCVRELSKVLDGPTELSYREMLHCVKYVLDSKDLGLRLEPNGTPIGDPWDIVCYSDSDWAGDPANRRSVSGYIIYVHGVPIVWRSAMQKVVSLSSTEAEWYSLSEAVKDIVFLISLCKSLQLQVRLPVTVRVDNTGTIFMSNNVQTSSRTRHIRAVPMCGNMWRMELIGSFLSQRARMIVTF